MKCYSDAGGADEFAKELGAVPIKLIRSGTAHEFVINRIYDAVQNTKRSLIVWGLTHAFRMDVPFQDPNTKHSMWATLNYDHIVGDDDIHNFRHIRKNDKILNILIEYNQIMLAHYNLSMKKYLEQVKITAGFLKSNGHDYIIWNQASEDYRNVRYYDWPVNKDINQDPGFYKIFDWVMNKHLYDKSVPFRPYDYQYFNNQWNSAMHPLECEELNREVSQFLLQNLQIRNLI